MLGLGIDTSGIRVAVAVLAVPGGVAFREERPGGREGSRALARLLDRALTGPVGAIRAPDLIAVSTGPGPFTALRVGLAAAHGLGAASRIPVFGIPGHRALAAGLDGMAERVVAVLDAGRGEVWVAEGDDPGRLMTPEALAERLEGRGVRLAGPGAERHRERLESLLGPGTVLELDPATGAVGAVREGARRLSAGENPVARPLYPRPPDAVPPGRPS